MEKYVSLNENGLWTGCGLPIELWRHVVCVALMEYSEFDDEEGEEAGLIGDTVENNSAMEVRRHKLKRMK